jgi:phosphatidylcholine synthase
MPHRPPSRVLAWAVHAFTASGIVMGLLALQAAETGAVRACLLWLVAITAVDGVDGTLARAARVKEAIPRVDGGTLDLVLDYFTWVVVPAVLLLLPGVLPAGTGLWAASAILVSALYHYSRLDIKTPDYYFNGFPAWWNVVAGYLLALRSGPAVNLAVVIGGVLLTFSPIHFIHPIRVRDFRPVNLAATAVWAVSSTWMLAQYPDPSPILAAASVVCAAWLVGVGVWHTFAAPRPAVEPHHGH